MKYWNSKLKGMSEYTPGEQPKDINEYIKLNTNENPFPPSEAVLEAIKKVCCESLKLYPDPASTSLREAFAKDNSLGIENVFAGNGSDEIFSLIFRGFVEDGGTAAFPYPSYSLYYTMAEANGVKYEKIPLNEKFDVDLNDYLKKKIRPYNSRQPEQPHGQGYRH